MKILVSLSSNSKALGQINSIDLGIGLLKEASTVDLLSSLLLATESRLSILKPLVEYYYSFVVCAKSPTYGVQPDVIFTREMRDCLLLKHRKIGLWLLSVEICVKSIF